MKSACAWCNTVLQMGTGDNLEPVSHGICHACAEKHFGKILESHPEVSEDPDQYPLELGDETGG